MSALSDFLNKNRSKAKKEITMEASVSYTAVNELSLKDLAAKYAELAGHNMSSKAKRKKDLAVEAVLEAAEGNIPKAVELGLCDDPEVTTQAPIIEAPEQDDVVAEAPKPAPKKAAPTASVGGWANGASKRYELVGAYRIVREYNPFRPNTKRYDNWKILTSVEEKTLEAALEKGADRTLLRYALNDGHIELV